MLRRDLFLHRNVPAADEQRCDRSDLRIEAGSDAALDATQVGLGGGEVMLAREQQGDIDRHAREDRFLDRRQARRRSRNLDEEIGSRGGCMLPRRGADRLRGVVGEQRGDLERDPAVDAAGRLEDRPQQIGRLRQVLPCEREEEVLAGLPLARQGADRLVVETAVGDGMLEDRGVRGQPRHRQLGDVPCQRAVRQDFPGDVVEPEALAELVEPSGIRVHHFSLVIPARPERELQHPPPRAVAEHRNRPDRRYARP